MLPKVSLGPMHDSFAPSYNPGWRNQSSVPHPINPPRHSIASNPSQGYSHPIFPQVHPPAQPAYTQPHSHEPSPSQSFQDRILQVLSSHTQSIAKLETQMGQLVETFSRQSEGNLHSQSVVIIQGRGFHVI